MTTQEDTDLDVRRDTMQHPSPHGYEAQTSPSPEVVRVHETVSPSASDAPSSSPMRGNGVVSSPTPASALNSSEPPPRVDRWGTLLHASAERGTDERQLQKDAERERKWIKMYNAWPKYFSDSQPAKVKRRIRKGVPDSLRGVIWPYFCGASTLKTDVETRHGKGYYAQLLARPSPFADTITRDLARTFPTHIMFRAPGDNSDLSDEEVRAGGRARLFNVLRAHSVHDAAVGYCQGMGFPTGLLLMYLDEETAFYCLAALARGEKFQLGGLWMPGFPLTFQCFFVFERLLQRFYPKLAAHLRQHDIPPELYATQWFMTLFCYHLPMGVLTRVWDVFLAEGPKVLFRLALTFMRILQPELLQAQDMAALFDVLKKAHEQPAVLNPDNFIGAAMDLALSRKLIDRYASEYQAQQFAKQQAQERAEASQPVPVQNGKPNGASHAAPFTSSPAPTPVAPSSSSAASAAPASTELATLSTQSALSGTQKRVSAPLPEFDEEDIGTVHIVYESGDDGDE